MSIASTPPIAEIRDLRVVAGGVSRVDALSLRIGSGQRWGVVGPSGAGKSLTAAAVAGFLPPGATATGSLRVGGTELVGAPETVLAGVRGCDVALVAQDSAVALHPLLSVGRQLAMPLRRHRGLDRAAARAHAVELLAGVDLPADLARARPAQLSGGQRQRVALAAALACRPHDVLTHRGGPVPEVLAAPGHEVTRELIEAARLSVPDVPA